MNKLYIKIVEWIDVIDTLNVEEGFDNEGFNKGFLVYKNNQTSYPSELFWFKSDKSLWRGLTDYVAKLP
jgi:hypothetical protein|tara:strand:+ start:280 stop:486 length:207 start_codon:yes stop_codon:yes gene_type:complete